VLKELIKIANELDKRGLLKEADQADRMIGKIAADILEFKPRGDRTVSDASKVAPKGHLGDLIDIGHRHGESEEDQDDDLPITEEEVRLYLESSGTLFYDKDEDLLGIKDEDEDFDFIVVLGDGETWDGDASIVKVTQAELEEIQNDSNVYNVITPDHHSPDPRWIDIWDVIKAKH
jgi:hypothetical protein